MPSLYSLRYFQQKRRISKFSTITGLVVLLFFFFPEYPKRLCYPFLFGNKTDEKLTISEDGSYEDVATSPVEFVRNNIKYILYPKTKYNITAKIGYIDHYDTFFKKMYRKRSQGNYINLVPLDLLMVYGDMAKPEAYNLFKFDHEERLGKVRCKGVKYKMSFFPAYFMSKKEFLISAINAGRCNPYLEAHTYNNYHPIPANENINKGLHTLLAGDVIYIEGYLVDVKMGNYILHTGTRNNQYHPYIVNGRPAGMCFILFTTKLIINGYTYQ